MSTRQNRISGYKRILRECIDQRPSGLRQKMARVLGTHKSFISQITNPADPTPIPARHLDAIIDVCHLGPAERQHFLAAYAAAHPDQLPPTRGTRHFRTLHIQVPVLADPVKQEALERLLRDLARQIARLLDDESE